MTEQNVDECVICGDPKKDYFDCLLSSSESGGELSEIGCMYQDLLQLSILNNGNETHLFTCPVCSEQLKLYHKFKMKAMKSYNKLLGVSVQCDVDVFMPDEDDEFEDGATMNGEYEDTAKNCVRTEQVMVFNADIDKTEKFEIQYLDGNGDELTNGVEIDSNESNLYDIQLLDNENYLQCDECDEIFEKEEDLAIHKQVHIRIIHCDYCTEMFWAEKQYMDHLYSHIDVSPPYHCTKCSKVYQDKKYFVDHLAFHTIGSKCDKCDKIFYKKSLLQVHVRTTHAAVRRYVCQLCDKRFKSSSHLRYHRYSHMGKQFECKLCLNKYSTPRTLREHLKYVHEGEFPFSCDICEKPFTRRNKLMEHRRDIHFVSDADNYADLDL